MQSGRGQAQAQMMRRAFRPAQRSSPSLPQQPTALSPGGQDAVAEGHSKAQASGHKNPGCGPCLTAPTPASWSPVDAIADCLTEAQDTGNQNPACGPRPTAQTLTSSVEALPRVSEAGPEQDNEGQAAIKDPQCKERLARWVQSLVRALIKMEAMFGRDKLRKVFDTEQGGAAAPGASGLGAGPLRGPGLFPEEDAATPGALSLPEGHHHADTDPRRQG